MLRLIRSFGFAWKGIRSSLFQEPNFKIHIVCSILVIGAAVYFMISPVEWMLVLICMALVLSMEMINTAIEKLCNVVHQEQHPGIKITKDVAAGAVLVSAIIAAVCGAIIFIPKIILLIKSINQ